MDPNNNQEHPISPIPAAQPVASAPIQPIQTAPPAPKEGHGKGVVLFLLIFLLIIGGGAYLLFANSQSKITQKVPAENNTLALPTPTAVPTVSPEDDLDIESPEADLNDIDADVGAL